MSLPVIVLAGGPGTGLQLLTRGEPKVLLRIAGRAVIEYVLGNLLELNMRRVLVVTDRPGALEPVLERYRRLGLELEVIEQCGVGVEAALLSVKDYVRGYVLIYYGDTLLPKEGVETILSSFLAYSTSTLMLVPEEDVRLYGAVRVDAEGFVTEFIEKPSRELEGYYAFGGLMIVNTEFFKLLEQYENFEVAMSKLIKLRRVRSSIWSGWWVDIGFPWDLLRANYFVLSSLERSFISSRARIASTAVIEGPVVIEDGAEIEHHAVIKGPVYIGRNSYVATHTLVRDYTTVEEESTIFSFTEVTWSSIQPRATIGRATYLGFSVVGSEAVIEPNVVTKVIMKERIWKERPIEVVRRGRKIMKLGSYIGKGARVPAGKVLEPGAVVE
ncbi:MAG: hypothetical protein DRJ40_04785 [Thermoprotei archaeon]|nr:MAG: hypothetical protein DRJ40_04740 [Thermoprotei archaeon]RLE56719.1 MAG: hypothetical protein DRJ40_04785 [Thermoprotei archaeon]